MSTVNASGNISYVNTDYGAGNYNIGVDASASDGTQNEITSLVVSIPFGTALNVVSAKILKAVKDWAEGLHGWTCPPANVIFTQMERGSAALLLLA